MSSAKAQLESDTKVCVCLSLSLSGSMRPKLSISLCAALCVSIDFYLSTFFLFSFFFYLSTPIDFYLSTPIYLSLSLPSVSQRICLRSSWVKLVLILLYVSFSTFCFSTHLSLFSSIATLPFGWEGRRKHSKNTLQWGPSSPTTHPPIHRIFWQFWI